MSRLRKGGEKVPKKELIAMVLAGGQGTRLGVLTKKIAKPAVPFGGKYRIIDFTLSNCSNSNIETVGVLTQYQPFELNSYIGIGSHWDMDRKEGGVFVLPPYMKETGGVWYKGTANAIYQNMSFIDYYDPEYVLILSGDHVYKMDYSEMLAFHKEKKAAATIAVLEVPWEEAGSFGIMATDEGNKIVEFQEKPKKPKSNLASMGIYIFNWSTLKKYLQQDEQNANSSNDFGKNVIPLMLHSGENLFAYHFSGYWKDVGAIESYWQANMDLLTHNPKLNLNDSKWRIYSVNPTFPPQYLGTTAKVSCSLISEGCVVKGEVCHSVLFPGVYVEKGAKISDSIVLPGVKIGENTIIKKSIIGAETTIGSNCTIAYTGSDYATSVYRIYTSGIIVFDSHKKIANHTIIGERKEDKPVLVS
jgi:glucose-1-phosphate adenylyltransferase